VSETLPSWTEYLLEFLRARGYSFFYPGATGTASLVAIHNELYHAPEEYVPEATTDPDPDTSKALDEPFLRGEGTPPRPKNLEPPIIPASRPLHLVLPFAADIPEIPHLPHLLYSGERIHPGNVSGIASAFADSFRETVGGCKIPEGKRRVMIPGDSKDLFCFGDEDESSWEDVVVTTYDDVSPSRYEGNYMP